MVCWNRSQVRQQIEDYLICIFGLFFLPSFQTAEENLWANPACYLYVFTFGLIRFTPIWTILNEKCKQACDFCCLDVIFDATTLNFARLTSLFSKDGFDFECKKHGIPTPQTFAFKDLPKKQIWVKPNLGGCGRGHFVFDNSANEPFPEDPEHYLFQEICHPSEEILKLLKHPHLATFRIQSIAPVGEKPTCIGPFLLRVGPPGSLCDNDNTKPGRYLITVDKMGVIVKAETWPEKEKMEEIKGMEVIGHKIESFKEVLPMVETAHQRLMPEAFSVGWDVALTTEGIRIIEVNYCSPVLHYFVPHVWKQLQKRKIEHILWLLSRKTEEKQLKNA